MFFVVPYSFSTSSHNSLAELIRTKALFLIHFLHQATTLYETTYRCSSLFLIHFLHQATTRWPNWYARKRCSLFIFYIKPQQFVLRAFLWPCCSLFIFYIKPQLCGLELEIQGSCSLFIFYIKPQQCRGTHQSNMGCSLFIFYIKPQLRPDLFFFLSVVPYSFSTSSHNLIAVRVSLVTLFLIHFLHQATTHRPWRRKRCLLFLIHFLHQATTPPTVRLLSRVGCSLFIFYIKPQLWNGQHQPVGGCSLFIFYIKPQLPWVQR